MRTWIPVTLLLVATTVGCTSGRKNRRVSRPLEPLNPVETLAEPPASYAPVDSAPAVTPAPPAKPAASKPKPKKPSIALPKPE